MRSPCCLCFCEYPLQLTSECLNQSIWNLSPSQWHIINPCNCSVNTFLRQRTIAGGVVFYAVRVVSKGSKRLVLPRTSCNIFLPCTHRPSGFFPSGFRTRISFLSHVPLMTLRSYPPRVYHSNNIGRRDKYSFCYFSYLPLLPPPP
jgi:hypothetical protein